MYKTYRPLQVCEKDVSNPKFWEAIWAQNLGPSERSRRSIGTGELWPLIRHRIPDGAKILDAGCGLGEWVDFLSSKGHTVTGLDYSSQTIERNRKVCPTARWCCGTLQEMPFPEAEFDCVISWGVIEHDEAGPQQALREFYRVLAPNGRAFIIVPRDSEWNRRSVQIAFPETAPNRGFFSYHFTPEDLSKQLTETQFTVEAIIPVCPSPLTVLFPRINRIVAPLRRWKVEGLCRRIINLLYGHPKESFSMYLAIAHKASGGS